MILLRSGIRRMARHPWQTILAVIGVTLGVGVVTAVDIANESALRSFRVSAETMAGKATHQVVGPPAGLNESVYKQLRVDNAVCPSAPVVEGYIDLPELPGTALKLVGIDPFAEGPFRTFSGRFLSDTDMHAFLTRPGSALLLESTARRLGLGMNDSIGIKTGAGKHRLVLCGFLRPDSELEREGLESVVVTDISTAQELLGSVGRLSQIDLIIPEGTMGKRLLERLRLLLPPGVTVLSAGANAGSLEQMTRAFRLNLTALSLLALVVGMFLIYNTAVFSVIRRRRLIGLLRAIGVTRRRIFGMLWGEAAVIGVTGTVFGLLFGSLLGRYLVRLVTRTINDLYFVTEVTSVALLPETFLKGVFLGIGATLVAAIPPALEATTAPPRAVTSRAMLEMRTRRLLPLACSAGLVALAIGAGFLSAEFTGIIGGFAGLFALIIGYSLIVPAATVLSSQAFRPILGMVLGVIGKIAARGIVTSISRTGVATAALVVAISATIGIGVMVESFRRTVADWLESWLRADIYVTTAGTGSGRNKPPMDPGLVERLSKVTGAEKISLTRRVTIQGEGGPTELLAMQLPESTFTSYRFREGDAREAWSGFSKGEAVMVSEPYAYRKKLHVGDRVTLRTAGGDRMFPVAGVFYDYGSDLGVVALSRSAYLKGWNDASIDGMGFYLAAGVHGDELSAGLRKLAGESAITIISNRALRERSLKVFDRTFAITEVLRLLIVLVAFVGILSALMAMQLERARELAVLRAIGLTPGQVWGVICGETGLIGVIAGVLSLPLGLVQAIVLVDVINRRSFGWTMQLSVAPVLLLQAVAISIAAALLAGVYPARLSASASPALALKEEE